MKRAALVIVLALAHAAGAHPLDLGKLRIDVGAAEVDVSLELDVSVVAREFKLDATRLDGETLAKVTYRLEPIAGCTWRGATAAVSGRIVTVTDHATCGELLELRWKLPFVTRMSPPFQLLVDAHLFDEDHVVLLDKSISALALVPDEPRPVALGDFVWKGVEQVGAAPSHWPDGIEHVLFLLVLLLWSASLRELVRIASGFAVGHTITFALATFVHISSSVIEPLIALTIALAAVVVLTGKPARHRWRIATGFGLVHGFGFALGNHTAKALLGNYLGIELGQIAIVLALAPLVLLLHRYPRVAREVAIAIISVAMYWFITRL